MPRTGRFDAIAVREAQVRQRNGVSQRVGPKLSRKRQEQGWAELTSVSGGKISLFSRSRRPIQPQWLEILLSPKRR